MSEFCRVQNVVVTFYVLRDKEGLYLIDGGFVGGARALKKALAAKGWAHLPIRGIVVTHGHLDHVLNVAQMAREHGAWIAAPALDAAHYEGKAKYSGWARVTGVLEAMGKALLGFRPFVPNRLLNDGDVIEVWGGLQVVALPGHTNGHIGLWSPSSRMLFTADLFASHSLFSHLPPAILNNRSDMMPKSVRRALALDPVGILPNHGDEVAPEVHLARLKKLAERMAGGELHG